MADFTPDIAGFADRGVGGGDVSGQPLHHAPVATVRQGDGQAPNPWSAESAG